MSVFTRVEQHELVESLQHYAAGELFETHSFEEMGFYLNMMAHLSGHNLPGAHPVSDREQNYLRIFKNKPAALLERLDGASIRIAICRYTSNVYCYGRPD